MRGKAIVLAATVGLAAGMIGGCQRPANVPHGRLEATQIDRDEAMDLRQWDQMSAYYANPRFIAGPTGFWFRHQGEQGEFEYLNALLDTPMFVGQTLFLPVSLILQPPLMPVEYAGETLPPTHHAMPPLPPSPRPAPRTPVVEPDVEPGVLPPAPYDAAPGEPVIPGTQPTRGLEGGMPTTPPPDRSVPGPGARPQTPPGDVQSVPPPAPRPTTPGAGATTPQPPMRIRPAPTPRTAPPTTVPATQPVFVPSAVAPRPDGPATTPAVRDVNK